MITTPRQYSSLFATITRALLPLALLCFTCATHANTAVSIPSTDNLLQTPSGLSVYGYEFVSSNDIRLTSVGILDNASDGLSSPHSITIWDDAGNAVLQLLFPVGGGELDSGFRYLDINPFMLTADTKYVIGVNYFDGNQDQIAVAEVSTQFVLDPAITILGGRSRLGSLGIPLDDSSEVYFGPNFRFTNVPLPGAVWLLLSGLAVLSVGRRNAA